MAVAVSTRNGSTPHTPTDVQQRWKERIEQAQRDRRPYERVWIENLAFAAGKYWLRWTGDGTYRRLVLPKLPKGIDRYTVRELGQYRLAALGELSQDDFLPQVLFRHDDVRDEEYAKQANQALGFGWDNEWDADPILMDMLLTMIDLGTVAIRVWFDKTAGPTRQGVVHNEDGPVWDPEQARAHVAEMAQVGRRASIRDIHEGRIRWKLYSPFGILPPPGVEHARDFPWEVFVEAVHIDKLRQLYPAARDVSAQEDLKSVDAQTSAGAQDTVGAAGSGVDTPLIGKLKDHVRLYTCFERPCPDYPQGAKVVLAGADFQPMEVQRSMGYVKPDGSPCSGASYFHYHRVTGRFWSDSLVDEGKESARAISKRRTQIGATIDRGQPKVFAEKGSLPDEVGGEPVAYVPLDPGAPMPNVWQGVPVGQWMVQEVESLREDLERATGYHNVSLGGEMPNNPTYSGLALTRQTDAKKREPVFKMLKDGIVSVCEDTLYDIKRYWGSSRQVTVAGDGGLLEAFVFNASELPDWYRIEFAQGATMPRDQASELRKIEDIAAYSVNARMPVPPNWYADSLQEGKPLPLPDTPTDPQIVNANLENSLMEQGQTVVPTYFDPPEIHVPIHRQLEIEAVRSGNTQVAVMVENHIQAHLQLAQENAQRIAQQGAQEPPGGGGPPAGPGMPPGLPPPNLGVPGPPGAPSGPPGSVGNGAPPPPAIAQALASIGAGGGR